ncbi:hypothetical protein [Zobellia galactanivorans]|uniref:Uncharacterized protein n=1 Tax=Zobellia galactanivorans (strain DSM 12802 / CCUG 47099 / CIP 106680 / NCIMB 13871 / Dsij) TaxID=63186 RepID=G0L9D4_ZOBGA|nr:hypothetical protein [Zobellia galactanivorans]CAZ94492.1 Conserved hypothetical protein [Zobellia galactanivorans]
MNTLILKTALILITLPLNCNSGTNGKIKTITKTKQTIAYETKPLYSLKITSGNPYESYINDVVLEKDYEEGSTDHELPINDLILSSGTQEIKIKLLPNRGKNEVNKLDVEYFEAKIYLYENGLTSYSEQKKTLLHTFKFKNFVPNQPSMIAVWKFEAKVPYQHMGWSESVDLSKENKDDLLNETLQKYQEIRSIINEGNYSKYLKELSKKNIEKFDSFFADKDVKNDDLERLTNRIIDSKNNMRPLTNYHLCLYGKGKLVSLENMNHESPLIADIKDEYEEVFNIFLHRPKPGAPLEVIR